MQVMWMLVFTLGLAFQRRPGARTRDARYLPDQAPVIPTAHDPAALVAMAGSGHRPVEVVVSLTEGSREGRR
jgi:hypothetical protein